MIYDDAMVDVLTPADAKDFRAPLPGLRRIGRFIPVEQAGPNGSMTRTLEFVSYEEDGIAQEPKLSGTAEAGPKIGEPKPIRPNSFTEPIPVFIAPVVGEERI